MIASRRPSENTTGGGGGGGAAAAGGSGIRPSGPVVEEVDAVLICGFCEIGPVGLDSGIPAADT